MMRAFIKGLLVAATALSSLALRPAQVHAQEFYAGKTLTIMVGLAAGGSADTLVRLFAPHLKKHIPGEPSIVVQNMPGAGGIRAMQYFASIAPRDGSVLGLVHSSVPFAPLYGIKGATFDPRAMNWIGSINSSEAICVSWAASGVTQWKDLYDKTYIVGGTGAGSQMETMPAMINKLFGTKIKIISGYTGGNDVYLAMERGEVHGRCGGLVSSINSTRPDWFGKKKVVVPIAVALERNPLFPDTPAIYEFAKDDRTRQILKLILFPLQMDRPVLAPAGVPPERVAALRKAFHEAMTDSAFIADAQNLNIEIGEVRGERLQAILAEAFSTSPDIVTAANDAMNLTGASTAE